MKKRIDEIHARLAEILKEHNGLESNIPAVSTHEYWTLKSELNALRAAPSGNTTTESPAGE